MSPTRDHLTAALLLAAATTFATACTTGEDLADDELIDEGLSGPDTIAIELEGPLPADEPGDALRLAGRVVAGLAASAPDAVTGVRLDEDELVVALPADPARGETREEVLEALRDAGLEDEVAVRFAEVPHSRAAMDLAREEIEDRMEVGEFAPASITAVGEDAARGVVVVYAAPGSAADRATLKADFGDAIIFREGELIRPASRALDPEPHWAGASIDITNGANSATAGCSASFPINKSGVHYMLTAGHCLPAGETTFDHAFAQDATTTSRSSTLYFGHRSYTTWGGTFASATQKTQSRYGDFALLRGSTYSAHVYGRSGNIADVTAVDWGAPSRGESFCSSGRTTGTRCRYFVVDPSGAAHSCANASCTRTVLVRHLSRARHDTNRNGVGDCGGFDHGDSGGAIYQGGPRGGARAMGMIHGMSGSSRCSYWYSRLSGVKAWSSAVRMPTL